MHTQSSLSGIVFIGIQKTGYLSRDFYGTAVAEERVLPLKSESWTGTPAPSLLVG